MWKSTPLSSLDLDKGKTFTTKKGTRAKHKTTDFPVILTDEGSDTFFCLRCSDNIGY